MTTLIAPRLASTPEAISGDALPALLSPIAWRAAKRTTGKGGKGANPRPLNIASSSGGSRKIRTQENSRSPALMSEMPESRIGSLPMWSRPTVAAKGGMTLSRESALDGQQTAPTSWRKHRRIRRLGPEIADSNRHQSGVQEMSAILSLVTASSQRARERAKTLAMQRSMTNKGLVPGIQVLLSTPIRNPIGTIALRW